MTSPEFLTREQLGERYGKTPGQISDLVAREKRRGNVVRTEGDHLNLTICLDDFRRFCAPSAANRGYSEGASRHFARKAGR